MSKTKKIFEILGVVITVVTTVIEIVKKYVETDKDDE